MKPLCRSLLVRCAAWSLAAALPALGSQAQSPVDVAGEWDVTLNSPQGQSQSVLTLKQDGGKLTGSIKSPRGEAGLDSVTVKGSEIQFSLKRNVQGNEMVFAYTGKIEKDSMKGAVDFGGMATGDWSAVRKPATPATAAAAPAPAAPAAAAASGSFDISGAWQFAVQTDAGSGSPTFNFKQDGQKLTGDYSGALGQATLTGTLQGNQLRFSFKADAGGQSAEVTYTGKVLTKDSMEGTVSLAGLGEGTWTGKRR